MPGEKTVARNCVVALLGTPYHIDGSLNDPVEREEFGVHYNEKWTYLDLANDPAGVPDRIIYWHRYDFVATMVRANDTDEWRPDTSLLDAARTVDRRAQKVDDHHTPLPDGSYRPVSNLPDASDLGGYMQDQASGRRIEE